MSKGLMKLARDYKQYMGLFVFSIILAVASTGGALLVPVFLGNAIDLLTKDVDLRALSLIATKMVIVIFASALSTWVMNGINNRIVYGITKDLRRRSFESFVKAKIRFVDENTVGDIVSRIVVDCEGICDGLLLGFNQLFVGVVTVIATLVFMFRVNVILALIVAVLTPMSLLVARFVAKKTHKYFDKQAAARGELTELSDDIISMKMIIRDEGAEEYFLDKFIKKNDENVDVGRKAVFFSSLTNPLSRFVNNTIYASIILGGSLYCLKGGITVGTLTVFLAYATQYAKPFNDITSVISEFQNALVCIDRIYELIEGEREEEEAEKIEEKIGEACAFRGNINISNVDFGYTDEMILKDINILVEQGEKIAIVGPTGCGKTTIFNLLLKFYEPSLGRILIDDIDIRDIRYDVLRNNLGLVLQETFIKEGSVADNIRFGKKDASLQEVIAAAKECYAHDFIMKLPKGYDTIISNEDGLLSQGERQLICVSRLMLSNPSIVLLDEATSSIDVLKEQLIQKAFAKVMKGKTTFVVAHRLSTIVNSDRIICIKDGRVEEVGKHEELMKNKGFYYDLYMSQIS